MSYNTNFNNSIGISGPGFASRGKGSHIKRLSVAPPSSISTINENSATNCATPRTARGHMLAGLRTAPKSAVPAQQTQGLEASMFATPSYHSRIPQTAAAAFFPGQHQMYNQYAVADQVLAPPELEFSQEDQFGMDQELYSQLVAQNNYLAQQQRMLQQQLINVQNMAQIQQQMGALNVNGIQQIGYGMQSSLQPATLYAQQFQQQQNLQVQAVPGQPGVFAVYNPMTGQSNFVYDNSSAAQQAVNVMTPAQGTTSPPGGLPQQRSPAPTVSSLPAARSVSPPKRETSPPAKVEPLPPPSANAFRPGHRKGISSINAIKTTGAWTRDVNNSGPKTAGVSATPVTGTFGPGQARAGDHPVRQPQNPPHLSELQERPTSLHAGSRNFAARQHRSVTEGLAMAMKDAIGSDKASNSDSSSPTSDVEFNFSVGSSENELYKSGTISSKPSSGSLAAIGSERKVSHGRSSIDSTGSVKSAGSGENSPTTVHNKEDTKFLERKRAPLFVLNAAEKRKSLAM